MRSRSRAGALRIATRVVIAASLLASPQAKADPSPAERALATSLFRAGRDLAAAGKTREACEKFGESQRLDPSAGTLLNLALCHEELGLLATAWAELNDSLALALRDGRADREEIARGHLRALEPRLPRVTVELEDREPPPDLEVVMDDVVLRPAALRTPIPVDPGDHRLVAKAKGRRAFELRFSAAEGQLQALAVPSLPIEAEAPPPPLAPPPAPPEAAPGPPDRAPPEPPRHHDGQVGAFARADVDGKLRGAAAVIGATYGVGAHLEPAVGVMLGPTSGVWVGNHFYFATGAWKPFFTAAVPVYFVRGPRVSLHGAAGLQWDVVRHLGVFAAIGMQVHPAPPAGYEGIELVPSLGVQGRL